MNHYTIELQSRTRNFSITIIEIIRTIKIDLINKNIVSQILRSSTSIGANYNEAIESESRDDFVHKISICKKEATETQYWLELIEKTNPNLLDKTTPYKA